MAYPTPRDPTSEPTLCRVLRVPGTLYELLCSHLWELADPRAWEQSDGGITPDEAAALVAEIVESLVPGGACMHIGQIVPYVRASLPAGVLLCDGAQYSVAEYPELAAVLPDSLRISSEMFRVPDLRGLMLVGAGTAASGTHYSLCETGGAETHRLTIEEIPSHSHLTHTHGTSVNIEEPVPGAPYAITTPGIGFESTTQVGGGSEHNNMPPYFVVLYGIVARLG